MAHTYVPGYHIPRQGRWNPDTASSIARLRNTTERLGYAIARLRNEAGRLGCGYCRVSAGSGAGRVVWACLRSWDWR